MTEMFETVFSQVMDEMNLAWYELYDSDKFDIVVERIAHRLGISIETLTEIPEYQQWEEEMYWDL